jgi:recombination protein RecA
LSVTNDEAMVLFKKINPVLEKYLGDDVFVPDEIKEVPRIPSGLTFFDAIVGGGLPRGRITELYGPESTGKSTFFIQAGAFNQKRDPNFRVLYLDFEQTVTTKYLSQLGMIVEKPRLFLMQPATIEEGGLICRIFLGQNLVDMIIWDTPAASQPAATLAPVTDAEIRKTFKNIEEGKADTGAIGSHARAFSHMIGGLVAPINQTGCVFCVPNQIRTTINTWGAGETTPGGRALKFYAALRVRITRKQQIKESTADDFFGTKKATNVANLIGFNVVKNKTAPPGRECDIPLVFGIGYQDKQAVFDLAVKRKVIDKAGGGNFKLPDGTAIRGTEAVLLHFEEHPETWQQVLDMLGAPADWESMELIDPDAVIVSDLADNIASQHAAPPVSAATLTLEEAEAELAELPEGRLKIE